MFQKLVLKGMTIEEYKAMFGVKKGLLESEDEALIRTAIEKKGEKRYFAKGDRNKSFTSKAKADAYAKTL